MSIPLGTPILVEDMKEELNPVLEPLLTKSFTKEGNDYYV